MLTDSKAGTAQTLSPHRLGETVAGVRERARGEEEEEGGFVSDYISQKSHTQGECEVQTCALSAHCPVMRADWLGRPRLSGQCLLVMF